MVQRTLRRPLATTGWLPNAGKVQEDPQRAGNSIAAQRFVRRDHGLIKFARHGAIVAEDCLVDHALDKTAIAIARLENATLQLYR